MHAPDRLYGLLLAGAHVLALRGDSLATIAHANYVKPIVTGLGRTNAIISLSCSYKIRQAVLDNARTWLGCLFFVETPIV
jgi:hypothetical protein